MLADYILYAEDVSIKITLRINRQYLTRVMALGMFITSTICGYGLAIYNPVLTYA